MAVSDPIRTYAVTVRGFDALLYSARSPGKARARCYRDYGNYDDRCTFAEFMKISGVRLAESPEGIGGRHLVAGKPATRVVDGNKGRDAGNRLLFMYDDSDDIVCAHPSEIQPLPEGK